jgi:hypothetical protein
MCYDWGIGLADVQNGDLRKVTLWWAIIKILARNSSVGIATRYGLDGPGIESR